MVSYKFILINASFTNMHHNRQTLRKFDLNLRWSARLLLRIDWDESHDTIFYTMTKRRICGYSWLIILHLQSIFRAAYVFLSPCKEPGVYARLNELYWLMCVRFFFVSELQWRSDTVDDSAIDEANAASTAGFTAECKQPCRSSQTAASLEAACQAARLNYNLRPRITWYDV